MVSLKREFGGALHRLQSPIPGTSPVAEIRLDRRHFPYFLRNHELTLGQATLILKPREGEVIDVDGDDLRLNGAQKAWDPFPDVGGLNAKKFDLEGESLSPDGHLLTLSLNQGELSQAEGIWMLLQYSI